MSAVKPPRALAGFSRLAPDDQAWWIEHCYMLPSYNNALDDPARSVLVIGESGSGLTTSFDILRYYYPLVNDDPRPPSEPQPFFFAYPSQFWPGQPQSLFTADPASHFKQFMAHLADQIDNVFNRQPDLLARLARISHEFMAWLIRHYLGPRRGELWCGLVERHGPSQEVAAVLSRARQGDLDTLYRDDLLNDMKGQINECLGIVRLLGWNSIFAVAELSHAEWLTTTPQQQEDLRQSLKHLLENLALLQKPEFGFKLGVVAELLSLAEAETISRGRALVVAHSWTITELEELALRLWQAAGVEGDPPLAPLAWQNLEPDISSIWGKRCPGSIAGVIACWSELAAGQTKVPHDQLRAALYRHYAPLRYYPQVSSSQVWRGASCIALDEAQVAVFQALWRHGRTRSYASKEELVALAGSPTNLDKIISRIRKKLEPVSGAEIYLHRTQSLGTRLEHCLL